MRENRLFHVRPKKRNILIITLIKYWIQLGDIVVDFLIMRLGSSHYANVLAKIIVERVIIKNKGYLQLGYKVNLRNPCKFNEKLLWLNLNHITPLMVQCADKYRVREYVKACGCEEILNELIGVYEKVNDIDFDSLPNSFVIKATHGCGYNFICKDKKSLNIDQCKRLLNRWMLENYFFKYKEYIYKDITPLIIIEKYLEHSKEFPLWEYKIHCFNGEPKFVQIPCNTGSIKYTVDYYDIDWNKLPLKRVDTNISSKAFDPPSKLEELLEYAGRLSKDFIHVRVDFYYLKEQIILGELTFFSSGGWSKYVPEEYDDLLSSYIDLSAKNVANKRR